MAYDQLIDEIGKTSCNSELNITVKFRKEHLGMTVVACQKTCTLI